MGPARVHETSGSGGSARGLPRKLPSQPSPSGPPGTMTAVLAPMRPSRSPPRPHPPADATMSAVGTSPPSRPRGAARRGRGGLAQNAAGAQFGRAERLADVSSHPRPARGPAISPSRHRRDRVVRRPVAGRTPRPPTLALVFAGTQRRVDPQTHPSSRRFGWQVRSPDAAARGGRRGSPIMAEGPADGPSGPAIAHDGRMSDPAAVETKAMPATRCRLGSSAAKLRRALSPAALRAGARTVVATVPRRRPTHPIPASRIGRERRSRPTCPPPERGSAWTRGAPRVPRGAA